MRRNCKFRVVRLHKVRFQNAERMLRFSVNAQITSSTSITKCTIPKQHRGKFMCGVIRWAKPPLLDSNKIHELELHGVDSMRALLASSTDGFSGTGRKTSISLGNVVVERGEIQDWIKWKAAQDACWVKIGVAAAIAAAVFSLLALLK
jgi:hypothetical protein